jgi:hypothetical protein
MTRKAREAYQSRVEWEKGGAAIRMKSVSAKSGSVF